MEAGELIDGIARDLGASAEARKKWRQRGCIPHRWRLPIIREAEKRGIEVPDDAFEADQPEDAA
jgi:hypothetical protein